MAAVMGVGIFAVNNGQVQLPPVPAPVTLTLWFSLFSSFMV
ncbi:hypothetical protein [Corynebacterium cystitidis]|nr:hypothetical protein [Corynebacterium cystitidis]